jgi:hypothetical protein
LKKQTGESPVRGSYFSEAQVNIATFLAGPVPAGIMFFRNFMLLGRIKDAVFTILITSVAVVTVVILSFKLESSSANNYLTNFFSSGFVLVSAICYQAFLKAEVRRLKQEKYQRASNWKVVWYSIAGLIVFMSISFLVAQSIPPYPGTSLEAGNTENRMYFDERRINNTEVTIVAQALYDIGYFTDESSNAALIEEDQHGYTVTFMMASVYLEDPEVNFLITQLKLALQRELNKPVTLVLEEWDLLGNRSVTEI